MTSQHKRLVGNLLLVLFLLYTLNGCAGHKSLDNEDRSRIRSVLLSPNNIKPASNNVTAYGFIFGGKRYTDIIPAMQRQQAYGRILIKALTFQLEKNNLFKVTDDIGKADAVFYADYAVMLQEMENFSDYKLLTTFEATVKDKKGEIVWAQHFQLMNPYSSIPVSMPLPLYAQDGPRLYHALGVSLLELSKEVISSLGGTPYNPEFSVWALNKRELAPVRSNSNIDHSVKTTPGNDPEVAFEECRALAISGNANAQYKLGVMFEEGNGGAVSIRRAIKWYEKAASNGSQAAKNKLVAINQGAEESKIALNIVTTPTDATIRILNIPPKYIDGIQLPKGKYHVEISKVGYLTLTQWVNLDTDDAFTFSLKKHESIHKKSEELPEEEAEKKLTRLKKMFDKGLITEDEYKSERADVLETF